MEHTVKNLMASILLAGASATQANPAPQPAVIVQFQVGEPSAEVIEETIMNPLERALKTLARVTLIRSTALHHSAYVEITFEGGASELDLAAVADQIERLDLGSAIEVKSSSVRLGAPRSNF